MELNANASINDTLKQAQDQQKTVELYLRGGQSLKGQVASLSQNSIILGELSGRDFFDAQVLLDDITAIIIQVR